MNQIKFACPACGQHIAGEAGWSGHQVACPVCGVNFVIPETAGDWEKRTTAPKASAVQMAVPPCASAPRAGQEDARRLSKLSVACFALCLSGIGLVPGLVCGHLARRQISRDPGLKGNGFALAGLIIGYAGFTFATASLIGWTLLLPGHAAKSVPPRTHPPASSPEAKQVKGEFVPNATGEPARAEFMALSGSPGWESIRFRLANLSSKPITELALQYTFRDAQGQAIRETQMSRIMEPPLAVNETQELSGMLFPAAPNQRVDIAVVKRVDIVVVEVRFGDGTEWQREARLNGAK